MIHTRTACAYCGCLLSHLKDPQTVVWWYAIAFCSVDCASDCAVACLPHIAQTIGVGSDAFESEFERIKTMRERAANE